MTSRVYVGLVFLALILGFLFYVQSADLLPTFAEIKESREVIQQFVEANLFLSVLLFVAVYVISVALSLPIAVFLTLLAGFLFGVVLGTALVSFSATLGATIIFLATRFFFQDFVVSRFTHKISWLQHEMAGNGFRSILFLRLIPAVPFWLINVGAAVTRVRTRDYIAATFIGALPFTIVYVFAGTRFAEIDSVSDVVSLPTLLAVSLIVAVFAVPFFIRRRRREKDGVATQVDR